MLWVLVAAFDTLNAAITGAGVLQLNGTQFLSTRVTRVSITTNFAARRELDIQGGSCAWGFAHGSAATNLASLNVATGAEYRNSDTAYQFDALTGGGNVGPAFSNAVTLTVGVNNTSNNATYGVASNTATFSGAIKNGDTYTGVTTGGVESRQSRLRHADPLRRQHVHRRTTISGGVLSVASIGNGGVASGNLGSASNAAANLVFNGGTLQYTGSTATSDLRFHD